MLRHVLVVITSSFNHFFTERPLDMTMFDWLNGSPVTTFLGVVGAFLILLVIVTLMNNFIEGKYKSKGKGLDVEREKIRAKHADGLTKLTDAEVRRLDSTTVLVKAIDESAADVEWLKDSFNTPVVEPGNRIPPEKHDDDH